MGVVIKVARWYINKEVQTADVFVEEFFLVKQRPASEARMRMTKK
jgi:hypothetical protein